MKFLNIIFCFIVLFCSINAEARMYKCTDNKGKVSYGPTPCKENQAQKQIQEPYYNEAALQEEARIVAQRETQGKRIQGDDEISNVKKAYYEAIASNNLVAVSQLGKRLKHLESPQSGTSEKNNESPDLSAMQGQMQAQKAQMEMNMQAQKMQMEAQMRRMETQQRLIDQGILKK